MRRPPITARPRGAFCSPPSPNPNAIGIIPMIIARAVMRTGRKRVLPASMAATTGSPWWLSRSFAKERLSHHGDPVVAAIEAGSTRFRPVLMTALAMIIGMIPMALGLGDGGEQNAPLGRAVIGGLLVATVATLIFVPSVFSLVHVRNEKNADENLPEHELTVRA